MTGKHGTLAERFWAKVDKRGMDECWPWLARRNWCDYGVISRGGQFGGTILAHRASFEIHHGMKSAEGLCVLHSCDNPPCVNPGHLFLGDPQMNVADMVSKGRTAAGERHGFAKLTEGQVRAIRASGLLSRELAAQFRISQSNVCNIKSGRCWRAVT